MSLQQLQQEVRNVLEQHGRANRTGAVIAALVELGLAGFAASSIEDNEDSGAAAAKAVQAPGTSVMGDSVLLADAENTISIDPRALRPIHETARGWLDIDGGIYFDVGQHGAGSDSER
jgi:hypothetical protein